MTLMRTFLKRTVGQHSSNNNPTRTTSSLSTTIIERLNSQALNQTNDGYSSTSTLDLLINNHDDSMRRPLLHTNNKSLLKIIMTFN
jgi:hypothetical protein